MLGRFKQLKQGIQEAPLSLFARKSSEPETKAPEEKVSETKSKAFCDPDAKKPCITVCSPKPGCSCEAEPLREALSAEMKRRELPYIVGNAKMGCEGSCKKGPFIGFPQKGFFYLGVRPEDVPEVVEQTLVRGRVLFPYLSLNPERSYRTDIYYEKDTGLIAAIDDHVCMVEVAKYFLDFEEGLSCGKCIPCRLGMKRMQESVERITTGEGTEEDLEQIHVLCRTMIDVPLCEFAMTSSRPVLSALTYFEDEFKAHVDLQECPAGVCKDLVELQRKKARRRKKKK